MKLGPPWNVKPTAFNQALADGQILKARALMAQGQGPDDTSWDLGRLVDTPGALLFLNELKPQLSFLPGSSAQALVLAGAAQDKAERLGYRLSLGGSERKDKRQRL